MTNLTETHSNHNENGNAQESNSTNLEPVSTDWAKLTTFEDYNFKEQLLMAKVNILKDASRADYRARRNLSQLSPEDLIDVRTTRNTLGSNDSEYLFVDNNIYPKSDYKDTNRGFMEANTARIFLNKNISYTGIKPVWKQNTESVISADIMKKAAFELCQASSDRVVDPKKFNSLYTEDYAGKVLTPTQFNAVLKLIASVLYVEYTATEPFTITKYDLTDLQSVIPSNGEYCEYLISFNESGTIPEEITVLNRISALHLEPEMGRKYSVPSFYELAVWWLGADSSKGTRAAGDK